MANKKNILEQAKSESARAEALKYVADVYKNDRTTYDRALKLVDVLGLGGLWRGLDLAIMECIKAIKGGVSE